MKSYCTFYRRIMLMLPAVVTLVFFYGTQQLSAQNLEQNISGKWILESSGDQFTGGHILFNDGASYEFYKKYPDESGAEVKGSYVLNCDKKPAQLKLCLGDCGPGSEWTSSFCIVRINPECKLELYISSGGDFPAGFPADSNEVGMYVFSRDK